jgi:DNA helicase-2/ATP-dependent DNA helicase PcrA
MFKPRPGQTEVLKYEGGKMGIAAVPGSGKTHTLSCLAARLVLNAKLEEGQEVLIVTLVNSAVQNFSTRVSGFIKEIGLLPNIGYRVRTLHGLAHDIVRERPDLVGLSDQFSIIEERESTSILHTIVNNWLPSHPEILAYYLKSEVDLDNYDVRKRWPDAVEQICANAIRVAKDLRTPPLTLKEQLSKNQISEPLLNMVCDVYSDYQRALSFRSSVDFDDLISLALKALTLDRDFLTRLQWRWPFILEDEAQDSSQLQENILQTLCGDKGNWVRVGDPNQAIFETFTTASPEYLRRFLISPDVTRFDLSHSGRSTTSVIWLANELIRWTTVLSHETLRRSLSIPFIFPVPEGDPQPNPKDNPAGINLRKNGFTPDEELNYVVRSLKNWLPSHPEDTCAVLVPRNDRGSELAEKLKTEKIPFIEMLKSSSSTRRVAFVLSSILNCLADPNNSIRLSEAFEKIQGLLEENEREESNNKQLSNLIKKAGTLEDFISPLPGKDWLDSQSGVIFQENQNDELNTFREKIKRWQSATLLPIDQLLLIIGQDLFTLVSDLALVHKLALSLERSAAHERNWHLPEFSVELARIASNERKFLGFDEEDTGFDPERHKGKVLIATVHKAKGLEWDRVYLLSANNYDFPFVQQYDSYISEKWFIRDQLNLEAETISKLTAVIQGQLSDYFKPEGIATEKARIDYSSERIRLFYVGITRARNELSITWNTGRRGDAKPSIPFEAIRSAWEIHNESAS